MHPQGKHHLMIFCRLDIVCSWHGQHHLMIGGSDDIVERAAAHLKKIYDEDGYPTTVQTTRVDLGPLDPADVEDCEA